VAPGWLKPYTVGHYQVEVANDIFNGMGVSYPIALPLAHGQQYSAVLLGRSAL
jgi:hypothetical protein